MNIRKSNLNLATIESLSHDGRGIVRINNKITFLENCLPDEKIIFIYTKKYSKFDTGKTIKIIRSSPDRVMPYCKQYGNCGGCSLQHLNHQKQIEFKTKTIQELLEHITGLTSLTILPPIIGPTIGYRHKARISVKYIHKTHQVLIGFREKYGQHIVPITECPILHYSIGKKIHLLHKLVTNLTNCKYISQIEVACTNKFTALVFRNLKKFSESDIQLINEFSNENNYKIYSQFNDIRTIKPISDNKINYPLSYQLLNCNLQIIYKPTDFTQINHYINAQMVEHVLRLLQIESSDCILDLFCGVGNFTIPMATKCRQIIGIEKNEITLLQAKQNASNNKIENAEFYEADLSKELPISGWTKKKYSKILLDPPRIGARELCIQIKQFRAEQIIYISCNPATFARDAKLIIEHGYRLQNITLADMYPHTNHIESIASFQL